MSTTASFKQQCPSCEAMVPIRDANLIGRKIDCPKCKYRFVVEEPAEEIEADDDEESSKRVRDDEEEGEGKRSRGKRRRGADDAEEGGAKKGMPPKVLAMIGAGVVALVLLVLVGWWIFSGDDSPPVAKGPPAGAIQPIIRTPVDPDSEKTEIKATAASNADAITNMINPEAEGICNVRLQDLIHSEAGRMIFESPGSFRLEALKRRLGFGPDDIELLIQAWNFSKNWSYTIFHTSVPVKADALVAALHATKVPDKEKIENQDYYVLAANPWFDKLGQTTSALLLQTSAERIPARSGPLAMRIYDEQTIVIGDLGSVQDFLRVKGRFPVRKDKIDTPAETPPVAGAGGRGGMPGRFQLQINPGPGGALPRTGGATPPAADAEDKDEAMPSGNYLSLEPGLKRILDRVEKKKPILSIALNMRSAEETAPLSLRTLDLHNLIQDSSYLGASLGLRSGIVFTLALDYGTEDTAVRKMDNLQKDGSKELVDQLAKGLDTNVDLLEEDSGPRLPGQLGQPGAGAARGRAPGFGPGAGRLAAAGQARSGGGINLPDDNGFTRGRQGLGAQGRGGRGAPPGLLGQLPGGTQEKPVEAKPPGATIKITQPDKSMIQVAIRIIDPVAGTRFVNERARHLVLQRKGFLDMEGGGSRIHELARASHTYAETHQAEFPRGTAERPVPSTRAGRPYLPDQRVSWMIDLLPYLGAEQASLSNRIDRTKSWRDPENVILAATLIPQFLDPQNGRETWWVRYPKVAQEVAATHYVGIAGIGLDAAEYSAADAAVAGKLGIFGYDRSTKLAEIKDGLANTILIAEVPPTFKRPWLAGGGSTVVGVPEKNSIAPFVSAQRDGKRGANVIMADGSVRFIADNISDDVFKALCTVRGGEQVQIDRSAPAVGEPSADAKPPASDVKPQN